MFRTIVFPIVFIAAAGWLAVSQVGPKYNEIRLLTDENDRYDLAMEKSLELENLIISKNQQLGMLERDHGVNLRKILPDTPSIEPLTVVVNFLATENDLILKSLNFTQDPRFTDGGRGGEAPDFGRGSVRMSLEGEYEDFTNFVEVAEQEIRLMDIKSITFSSDSNSNVDGTIFDVLFDVYWLK